MVGVSRCKSNIILMPNKPQVFIFIGRSGCGKGTQADLLAEYLYSQGENPRQTLHIETGALLRNFVQGEGYTQKLCQKAMQEGTLMPEAVMVALWEKYLEDHFTGTQNVIFDGCPRKLHEAQLLDSALRFYGFTKPTVIFLNVGREWSMKRLTSRARKDDTPEAIERRLNWFDTEVMPTINYYKTNPNYNFVEINGEQPIEDVKNEILAKLALNR